MQQETIDRLPQEIWSGRGNPLRRLPNGRASEAVTEEARSQAIQHAHNEHPKEACGLFVSDHLGFRFIPAPNVSDDPENLFEISPEEVMHFMQNCTLQGVFHSHTSGELHPSGLDMQSQLSVEVPYYVCTLSDRNTYMDFWGWGDQLPTPPLKAREFRPCVTDCFELVRHFKHRHDGTVVPNFPRNWDWWDDSTVINPITHFMSESGWREIPISEIRCGDGLLFKIRNDTLMHCGVYTEDGLFLHHLDGKLSKQDPLIRWERFLNHVMRYDGAE